MKYAQEVVAAAKERVEKKMCGKGRLWLEASVDSYQESSNRVTLYVLQGSPPVGYVLAAGNQWARAYSSRGNSIGDFWCMPRAR